MKSPYAYTLDHLKLVVAISGVISMWTIFLLRPSQMVHVEIETKAPPPPSLARPVNSPHKLPNNSSTKRPSHD